jgi:hypothetical protein
VVAQAHIAARRAAGASIYIPHPELVADPLTQLMWQTGNPQAQDDASTTTHGYLHMDADDLRQQVAELPGNGFRH